MSATNDTTASLFVTKDKFSVAALASGLDSATADSLWAKLADASSQRIIGGVTAPREDAANVNNWHWFEKDCAPWAKERLTELLCAIATSGIPDKGWCKVTSLESCEGDASVSNRKGKRIVAFELNIKCTWKGQVDFEDVEGELHIPYLSEDVSDCKYEVKLTAKEPKDDSHVKALRHLEKVRPAVLAALKTFTDEIYVKGGPASK